MASPLTSTAGAWRVGGASVRGASHAVDGRPNQDALATWNDDAGSLAVIAVADGHGGARHLRSDVGARLAVDTAVAVLRGCAARLAAATAAERANIVGVDVPHAIATAWTAAAHAHLDAQAISDAEWAALADAEGPAAVAAVRSDPLLAYGATVLAALASPAGVAVTQLGDGDVLAVDAAGHTTRPIAADERLGGNLTTSLCRAGAEADFRGALLAGDARPALLLLATDGYANSFRSDADFLEVGRDLHAMFVRDGHAHVAAALPAFLEHASINGSGDDITLAFLEPVADPATPAATVSSPAPDAAREPGAAVAATSRQVEPDMPAPAAQRRRPASGTRALLVVALVAAAAMAAWLLRDPGRSTTPDQAPTSLPSATGSASRPSPATPDAARPATAHPDAGTPLPERSTPGSPPGHDDAVAGSSAQLAMVDAVDAALKPHAVDVTARVASGATTGPCTAEAVVADAAGAPLAQVRTAVADDAARGRDVALRLSVPLTASQHRSLARASGSVVVRLLCDGQVATESAAEPIATP